MTQASAHSIVQRECAKRGRQWGARNAIALREVHRESFLTNYKTARFLRALGDGCYAAERTPSLDEQRA